VVFPRKFCQRVCFKKYEEKSSGRVALLKSDAAGDGRERALRFFNLRGGKRGASSTLERWREEEKSRRPDIWRLLRRQCGGVL
jgi:hypothetical protein